MLLPPLIQQREGTVLNMMDRMLILAAVAPDGEGNVKEIAEMIGTTLNTARVNASWLRGKKLLEPANGKGALVPTVKGYRRALSLLKPVTANTVRKAA